MLARSTFRIPTHLLLAAAAAAALLLVFVASASAHGSFAPSGELRGARVTVGGIAPRCARGHHVRIRAGVQQGRRAAYGTSRRLACDGRRQRWEITLRGARGRGLKKGPAIADATATIVKGDDAVASHVWQSSVTVTGPRAVGAGRGVADMYDFLSLDALRELALLIAGEEGGPYIGWIAGKLFPRASEAEVVSKQLVAIEAKLDKLEGAISALNVAVLEGQKEAWQLSIAKTVADIEQADRLLGRMLDERASRSARTTAMAEFKSLVKDRGLEHAQTEIMGILKGGRAIGPGLINKAYEVQRTRYRFFSNERSLEVRELFDSYAYVMLRNLVVLRAFWVGTGRFFGDRVVARDAGEDEVTLADITEYVDDKAAEIRTQRGEVLKEAVVPVDSMLDLKTSLMWHWQDDEYTDRGTTSCCLDRRDAARDVFVTHFGSDYRFRLPERGQFEELEAGATGVVVDWLRAQGWPEMPIGRRGIAYWTASGIGTTRDDRLREHTVAETRRLGWNGGPSVFEWLDVPPMIMVTGGGPQLQTLWRVDVDSRAFL